MAARARCSKDELIVVNRVNEQPIGLDVAFAETSIVARKRMIAIALFELFAIREFIQNFFEFR